MIKQIIKDHPNDVRFIYRHFPLTQIHKHSDRAAQTAQAAASMGKFWEMHDALFENQEKWTELADQTAFDAWVDEELTKLSIDKKIFREKIQDKSITETILTDLSDGTAIGVDSTPTFFVNGQKTSAQNLSKIVDDLVKQ